MYKVTLRVVETMAGKGQPFDTLDDAVMWVADQFINLTGGVTVNAPGVGIWKDEEGNKIKELGQDVYTFTDDDFKVRQLREIGRDLKGWTRQDCVLFTVEDVRTVEFL